MTNEETLTGISQHAADAAMRAAVRWVQVNRPDLDAYMRGAGTGLMVECIREEMRDAVGPAMEDAREAFEAGMYNVGTASFVASMQLAGCKAAEKWAMYTDTGKARM